LERARKETEIAGRDLELKRQELELKRTAAARVKLAALTDDPEKLRHELRPADLAHGVRFRARAVPLGYKNPSKRDVYRFELFPAPDTPKAMLDSMAMITYRTSHPTFQNTFMAAGPERGFKVSYDGWGCLTLVIAVIEFRNPDRWPGVAMFDMCELLMCEPNDTRAICQ
jgi:hypothetical protein